MPVDDGRELWLQVGDGWERVIWSERDGRVWEWQWDDATTPGLVDALLAGRACERRTVWRRRVLASELVWRDRNGGERTVASGVAGVLARPLVALGLTRTVDVALAGAQT